LDRDARKPKGRSFTAYRSAAGTEDKQLERVARAETSRPKDFTEASHGQLSIAGHKETLVGDVVEYAV
jgi:hypothetical protein